MPLSPAELNSLEDMSSGFSLEGLPTADPTSEPSTGAPTTAPTDQATQTPSAALVTKTACPSDCNGNGDCLAGGICACYGGWSLRSDCSQFVLTMSVLGNTSELSQFGGPTATLTVRVAEIAGMPQVPTSAVECDAACSPSTEAYVPGSKVLFKMGEASVAVQLWGVVSHRAPLSLSPLLALAFHA